MRTKSLVVLSLLLISSYCQAETVLKETNGSVISFSSLKGKWVFINYWAGWCKTCIEEIPELNRFYQKHQQDSVALFAVNYDALSLRKQNKLIKKFNIQYPSLASDPGAELGITDIAGVPVTFVFNPKGELVQTLYGGQNLRSLEKQISAQ